MAEYKDCEALIKHLREIYCSECNSYNGVRCRACEAGDIIDMIDDAPAFDVKPVVHAKWKYGKCTHCGTEIPTENKLLLYGARSFEMGIL